MPALTLIFEKPAWPDLAPLVEGPEVIGPHGDSLIQIAYLERGMSSGEPSVAIRIDIAPDEAVVAETSLALFRAAAQAMETKRCAFRGALPEWSFLDEIRAMRAILESGVATYEADQTAVKRLIAALREFEETA